MVEEEENIRPNKRRVELIPLEALAVAELRAYIAELRNEIARVEVAISAKEGHRSAADAFFRKT